MSQANENEQVPVDPYGIGDFFDDTVRVKDDVTEEVEKSGEEVVSTTADTKEVVESASSQNEETEAATTTSQEAVKEATPEEDIVSLRNDLSQAMAALSELTAKQLEAQTQSEQPKLEVPKDPQQISQLDFLRGRDVADILGSPEGLNGLLNEVATVAARAGQQAGYEQALRSIPQVVQSTAQQQFRTQAATESFFSTNADLKPFRHAVSMAAVDFYQKNPTASIEQILEGAGKKTREVLRMRGTVVNRTPAQPAVAMAGAGQRTQAAPKLNSVEQQIAELLDLA